MAGAEQEIKSMEDWGPVEILALFLSGKIKTENLSENNTFAMSYYLGLMDENPEFASKVLARQYELEDKGIKTQIFSKKDLENAKRHKSRKHGKIEKVLQPSLWEETPVPSEPFIPSEITDPERGLYKEFKKIDKQHYGFTNTILDKESKTKRMELREKIGLPIARGRNSHVNDDFYKYLVKKVYVWDSFGIFSEYDRSQLGIDSDLQTKIDDIKEGIFEVLDPRLTLWQKRKRFQAFSNEFKEKWGMDKVDF